MESVHVCLHCDTKAWLLCWCRCRLSLTHWSVECRRRSPARPSTDRTIYYEALWSNCERGVHLGCGYLISGIGLSHKSNVDLLGLMAARIALIAGPWIIGADWNGTAQELRDTGWLELVGGVIVAPDATTCNNRTIDFLW